MKVIKECLQWLSLVIVLPILFVIMLIICLLNLFLYFIYGDIAELNIKEIKK